MGTVRCVVRLVALLLLLLLCIVPHLITRWSTGRSSWPRRFLKTASRLLGVRVEMDGRPQDRDVFFIANHVSWLDIAVLGGVTGCAFVSRDDIAHAPLVGWLAAQNDTIFVARAERGKVREQIGTLRMGVARRQPVTLFPEGTTGDGRTLLPFKPALFAVLFPPPRGLRVQPVVIDYGDALADVRWLDDEPGVVNARRILRRKGAMTVTLRFLAAFDPGDHADRKAIAAQARMRMAAALPGSDAGPGEGSGFPARPE